MACLCQTFERWLDSEPAELENDRPTDDELAAYEKEEEQYNEMFNNLVDQASRLSSTLGVGQIRNPKIARALRGFLREGVRFAFSTDGEDGPVGSRLAFLRILSK